ncbi:MULTISPECIES: hypothetical protein [Halorubrum]|uniref:hypothetical protein n=1 Tax=Halorubrum TaxID=56688 RepID=UPI000BD47396|nr:hypothetical protein DJ77_03635 [Halorubrum ezzemoulense]OYR79916.1 hypothetical protein DJ84_16780 [Halorubrum ezzemoulense]PHQ43806.1 hypothetical protein Z052_01305 [Halorubrum sp. C191]
MSDAPSPNDAPAPDDSLPLLGRVRTEPRSHAVALVAALGVGVALATVHWLGLIAAGALASLVAPTVRRGVAYALGAGIVALAAFAVGLGSAAAAVPGMRPVVYLTVGAGLALLLFGSLARAVVS